MTTPTTQALESHAAIQAIQRKSLGNRCHRHHKRQEINVGREERRRDFPLVSSTPKLPSTHSLTEMERPPSMMSSTPARCNSLDENFIMTRVVWTHAPSDHRADGQKHDLHTPRWIKLCRSRVRSNPAIAPYRVLCWSLTTDLLRISHAAIQDHNWQDG